MRTLTVAGALALACTSAFAQEAAKPAPTVVSDIKSVYNITKNNLLKAAEKMPEEAYASKPTPEVRSFAGLIGHVADAQYLFCGAVAGEKKQMDVEKTKTSKADLSAALKAAFEYCDAVYDKVTEADASTAVKFFGSDRTKLGVLAFNNAHNMEHYGNVVTYMRLKGLVPPSSEARR